jgi:hypothetical protein
MSQEKLAMSTMIANALIVDSPLSAAQLELAYHHFVDLAERLQFSGPRFSQAREEARDLGNKALARIRSDRDRAEQQQRQRERDDGLMEIR